MNLETSGVDSLSIVIPVFNSEPILSALVERLEPVLEPHLPRAEVILINDGSRDRSWDTIARLVARYPWVRGIDLLRNYGQHNALLCGIRAARYETIVTLDDDLQHPPEQIPSLLGKLAEGYDAVYGTPLVRRHGFWRHVSSELTRRALQTAMGRTARDVGPFRAFRTRLRDAFASYGDPFVSIDVLLTWGTTRFAAVQVPHDRRSIGPSNYTFRSLASHALDMMTGFSVWPLRLASLVGFGFTLFGIAVLAFVLIRYVIHGGSVPGFAFLASIIAIFSGAQLFALGIIGEYLARVHFRMMERPAYVVAKGIEHERHSAGAGTA